MISIESLDRIALKVKDIEASANWYERILGLQRVGPSSWNPYSVYLQAGDIGIALLPAATPKPSRIISGDWLILDHIAFRIPGKDFDHAQDHLKFHGVPFVVEKRAPYCSILFKDPDGYRLELVSIDQTSALI
ncbi:MAG: VOC family protein [Bacteroidota bacterium]